MFSQQNLGMSISSTFHSQLLKECVQYSQQLSTQQSAPPKTEIKQKVYIHACLCQLPHKIFSMKFVNNLLLNNANMYHQPIRYVEITKKAF